MTLDTLKKTGLIVGIAAGISTIIVAVAAVVTLFMNVATKDDIADLKAEMQTGIQTLKAEMQTGFTRMNAEITGPRNEVDADTSAIKADVRESLVQPDCRNLSW